MKNIEKAVYFASVLNKKDLIALRRMIKKKFISACRDKHKVGKTIRRRESSKEKTAGKHKSMLNIIELAIGVATSEFILIDKKSPEIIVAKQYVERIMSEYMGRDFIV